MPPLHRVLTLAAVSVLVLTGCTPPADVPPGEVTSAADAVRELPGVDHVAVTRTPSGAEPVQGNFGQLTEPTPSTVSVEVTLAGTLEPRAAGEAAGEAHRLLVAAAGSVDDGENITMASSFVGGPGLGVSAGPDTTSEVVADAVEDGFGLLAAGATTVDLGLGGGGDGSWDDDPLAATAHVSAATRDDFLEIARAAEDLDRGVELQAPGVLYRAATRVPDVDAVRLLVAAAARPGVVDATYLSQEQRLTLRSDAEAGSQNLTDLHGWLETQDFATADHPVAYTVMDAAYAETTGWVSGVEPAGYAPHTLEPFGDAEPWPEDPTAPDCTARDLAVTFGAVDSAAGTRGASVRASNVSGVPCAVENVPELVFLNDAGEAQPDVATEPYEPGVVPGRVVVPDGGTVLAPLLWRAMSTANDPDTTTTIEVTTVPRADPVPIDVTTDGTPATGLDVLDGAEVRIGPWTQGD
ncbi:DUF4232 domain-containing protein [Promicromonospora kroppenstedtii]|uniref:DUF4232 domain-containing protein n=1 Tax=Promicromonospora kroppenstedtii TaxID=440482 RepID=A0ABW7XS06_9MICO